MQTAPEFCPPNLMTGLVDLGPQFDVVAKCSVRLNVEWFPSTHPQADYPANEENTSAEDEEHSDWHKTPYQTQDPLSGNCNAYCHDCGPHDEPEASPRRAPTNPVQCVPPFSA
jgi:hypothetical protein